MVFAQQGSASALTPASTGGPLEYSRRSHSPIDSVRTKGTLGPGGQRSCFPRKMLRIAFFCQTIDNTSEADNEPDFDLNPKKGELLIKDADTPPKSL